MLFVKLTCSVILGLIPAFIAQKKGRNFYNWWIYGTLLFILALPHAILIKNKNSIDRKRDYGAKMICENCGTAFILDSDTKKCPKCRK